MFLAMGFTGKAAAKWKEAYIMAFNSMEAELLKHRPTTPLSIYPTPEQRESIVNAIRQLSGITAELTNALQGEYIAKNEQSEPIHDTSDYFTPADDLELDSIIDAICSNFKLASSFKIAINLRLLQTTGVSADKKAKRHIPMITNQLHQVMEITKTIQKYNVTSELDGLRRLVLKV